LTGGALIEGLGAITAAQWAGSAAYAAAGASMFHWRKPIMDWVHNHSPLLIHAMAEAGRFAEKLGNTVMSMAKKFASIAVQIGQILAKTPFLQAIGNSMAAGGTAAMNGLDAVNKGITPKQVAIDSGYLGGKGAGGLVAAIEGPKQVIQVASALPSRSGGGGNASGAPTQNYNAPININFNIDGSKDPKAVAKAIHDHMKNEVTPALLHASGAISRAGGVSRSRIQFGKGQ
jgi:hypothetical protein